MKEKIIWILIAIMAAMFLYLKIKQAVVSKPEQGMNAVTEDVQVNSHPERSEGSPADAGNRTSVRDSSVAALPQNDDGTVRIGDAVIAVEIASTDAARAQGLSGRPALAEDRGMLFIMDKAAVHYFWMKDMRFPLDILWIREGRVVDISANVPAPEGDEAPMVVYPSVPADQALEVNAGFAQTHSIETGNAVRLEI